MQAYGIKETTSTTGTGNLTIAAATGFVRFSDKFAVGVPFYYSIIDSSNAPIEYGIGVLSGTNTLVRTRPRATYVSSVYDDTNPSAVSLTGTNTVLCGGAVDASINAGSNIDSVSASMARYVYSAHGDVAISNNKTLVADRIWYVPFLLLHAVETDAMIINVTTAVASTKARVGLYGVGSNGYMTDLIDQTGDIDTTSTGIKVGTFSATRRLAPGWHIFGIVSNGAPAVTAYNAGNATGVIGSTPFGTNTASGPVLIVGRYEGISGGWSVIPTTPNSTTTAELLSSTFVPRVWIRAVN